MQIAGKEEERKLHKSLLNLISLLLCLLLCSFLFLNIFGGFFFPCVYSSHCCRRHSTVIKPLAKISLALQNCPWLFLLQITVLRRLSCLANSLALFLFALFYKRVEDPKQSNCLILFTLFSRIEENSSTLLYGFFLLFFPCTCLQPVAKEMKAFLHHSGTAELVGKCLLAMREREFPLQVLNVRKPESHFSPLPFVQESSGSASSRMKLSPYQIQISDLQGLVSCLRGRLLQ